MNNAVSSVFANDIPFVLVSDIISHFVFVILMAGTILSSASTKECSFSPFTFYRERHAIMRFLKKKKRFSCFDLTVGDLKNEWYSCMVDFKAYQPLCIYLIPKSCSFLWLFLFVFVFVFVFFFFFALLFVFCCFLGRGRSYYIVSSKHYDLIIICKQI